MKALFTIIIFAITFFGSTYFTNAQTINTSSEKIVHRIYLYPNPVSSNILKIVGEDILSIEIINIIGQKIKNWEMSHPSDGETILKFSNIDKGLYIVKCTFTDKEQIIKKFLIK